MLRAIVGATGVVLGVLVVDVPNDLLRGLLGWVPSTAMTAVAALFSARAAERLRGHPARRFWLVMAVGMLLLTVGNAAQAAAVVASPHGSVPVTYTPVLAASVGLCLAVVVLTMITYPMAFESRLARSRYWLDLATVLTVAAAFGASFAAREVVPAGSAWMIAARLVSGPVMQFLTVFGVTKLLMAPAPPFTRAAGVLGGLGVGISAVGTGIAPALQPTSEQHWFLVLEVVTNLLIVACTRAQVLGTQEGIPARSRTTRSWSVLPYLAIAAVYSLLAFSLLPAGLVWGQWVVVVAATVATGLVVARQLAAFADIQRLLEERDSLVGRLEYQAFHDGLTGLANRVLFFDLLEAELARCRRTGRQIAVLLVDLDDFKPINDLHGHDAGDAVLVATGLRLVGAVREGDVVARLGGDEFALVLVDVSAPDLDAVVDHLVRLVQAPVPFGDLTLAVGCSVGAVLGDGHDRDTNELVKAADEAMYSAKAGGKGRSVLRR